MQDGGMLSISLGADGEMCWSEQKKSNGHQKGKYKLSNSKVVCAGNKLLKSHETAVLWFFAL